MREAGGRPVLAPLAAGHSLLPDAGNKRMREESEGPELLSDLLHEVPDAGVPHPTGHPLDQSILAAQIHIKDKKQRRRTPMKPAIMYDASGMPMDALGVMMSPEDAAIVESAIAANAGVMVHGMHDDSGGSARRTRLLNPVRCFGRATPMRACPTVFPFPLRTRSKSSAPRSACTPSSLSCPTTPRRH